MKMPAARLPCRAARLKHRATFRRLKARHLLLLEGSNGQTRDLRPMPDLLHRRSARRAPRPINRIGLALHRIQLKGELIEFVFEKRIVQERFHRGADEAAHAEIKLW